MIDSVKPYLDMAAGITQATVARAVESAQGVIARNGVPGSDLLDQAQIGSLGLVSINLGTDQDFQDDSGAEALEDPAVAEEGAKGTGKKDRKSAGKKGKRKGKAKAEEDASGSDVLDQAQIGSMGLLSVNLGGRQRLVDDHGAEAGSALEAEVASLRADVARLAEALVAIGVVELEHMETVPRRASRKRTARKRAGARKAPARKAAVKKAPVRKASVKKAPVKKAPARKAAVKKAPVKKAPARKAAVKKAPVRKAPARKAPARKPAAKKGPAPRRSVADD